MTERLQYQFTGAGVVSIVPNADGTVTVTISGATGVVTLTGDTNGPSDNNQTNSVHAPTATSAGLAAGGAAALPVTPQGYVNLPINDDPNTWIPFYKPGT